jgi:hypothetical protein
MTEVNVLFFSTLDILVMATGVAVDEETGWCKSVICEKTSGVEYERGGAEGTAILGFIYH